MTQKSPLGKIKDVADVAVGAVTEVVKETVKDPVGTGQKVIGAVGERLPRRKRAAAPTVQPRPEPVVTPAPPAQAAATTAPAKKAAKKAPGKKAAKKTVKKAPAKKATKKAPAKKAPTTKAPAPVTEEG